MGLLDDRLLWLSAVGALLSGGLLLAVVGYLAVIVYGGLVTGGPLVGTLVGVAVPVLVAVALLFTLLVVSTVGLTYALARNASLPRSERLAGLAARVEDEYGEVRVLGLSELLAPPEPTTAEREADALDALKRRYVDGEITEGEFERKVDRLVANESVDEARADRERRRTLDREPERR